MIQKPRPCKGFLLTSTSLGALNPFYEFKLVLLIEKIKINNSQTSCALGLCATWVWRKQQRRRFGCAESPWSGSVSYCTKMMWTKRVKDLVGCLPIFDKWDIGKSSVTWRRNSCCLQLQGSDHAIQESRLARQEARSRYTTHQHPKSALTATPRWEPQLPARSFMSRWTLEHLESFGTR